MKSKEHIQRYRRFWAISLTVVLIMFGQFLIAVAQTSNSKITTTGADDTFEQTLAQPAKFLQSLGITPEEIQKQLRVRPRISVGGAGFVRNLEMASFTKAESIQSSIQIEGAGAARVVGLAAFTEAPDQLSSEPDIHVAGAGSVRNVGLVALPGQ